MKYSDFIIKYWKSFQEKYIMDTNALFDSLVLIH